MENTMVKFSQLKNEILQSYSNTAELIKLTDELHNACEKYSKVKELFWKVSRCEPIASDRSPSRSGS